MSEGFQEVTFNQPDGYHGKHRTRQPAGFEVPPVNVDRLLAEARQHIRDWEGAERGSAAEFIAAEMMTSAFAVLDMEAKAGILPGEWRPAVATQPQALTTYQQRLVAAYGTCKKCGGPLTIRTDRLTGGGGGKVTTTYCTICGEAVS